MRVIRCVFSLVDERTKGNRATREKVIRSNRASRSEGIYLMTPTARVARSLIDLSTQRLKRSAGDELILNNTLVRSADETSR